MDNSILDDVTVSSSVAVFHSSRHVAAAAAVVAVLGIATVAAEAEAKTGAVSAPVAVAAVVAADAAAAETGLTALYLDCHINSLDVSLSSFLPGSCHRP